MLTAIVMLTLSMMGMLAFAAGGFQITLKISAGALKFFSKIPGKKELAGFLSHPYNTGKNLNRGFFHRLYGTTTNTATNDAIHILSEKNIEHGAMSASVSLFNFG